MLKQQPFLRSQVHGLIRSCPHQAPPIAGRASPCVHRLRRRQGPRPPCCRWAQPVARCRSALHASGWAPRGRRAARARRRRRWAPRGRRCRWARLLRRRQRMQRPVRLRACPLRCAVLQACARACIRSPRLHTPRDQASSWQYAKLRCHSQVLTLKCARAQRQKHRQLAAAQGAHSVCVAASAGPAAAPASAPAGACRAPASAAGAATPSLALPLRGMSDRYATSTPLRGVSSAHPSAGVACRRPSRASARSCCSTRQECKDRMQRPHRQAQQASAPG